MARRRFPIPTGRQFRTFAVTRRRRGGSTKGVRISTDGRGRCLDTIFVERLWRLPDYEAIYLHEIAAGLTARRLVGEWVRFCNDERPRSTLGGRTPAETYLGDPSVDMMGKLLCAVPTYPKAPQQRGERFKGILTA